MRLSHAVPVIEDAVFRMGLTNEEIAYLLETEVELRHLRRGPLVRAQVCLDGVSPSIRVCELPPPGRMNEEAPIRVPLQPSPQHFLQRVEAYQRTKIGKLGWEIALANCLSVEAGFSVVELTDHPLIEGEVAVLPHSRLAATDRHGWTKGVAHYVAVCRAPSEHRDGAPPWYALNPKWMATRADSIFLRLMICKFLQVNVRTEVYSGIGLVVLGEHGNLGEFVGRGGQNVRALQRISGCHQIVVAREPGDYPARYRLKYAIEQLTPVRRFRLIEPGSGHEVWTIVVHPDDTKRLVGKHGTRLMFAARLARLRVQVAERTQV